MKAWKHFCTITHHKYLVAKGCFAVGLYYQGLMHDMSKYSWIEFRVGAKYFQGTRSPNNAEKEEIVYYINIKLPIILKIYTLRIMLMKKTLMMVYF